MMGFGWETTPKLDDDDDDEDEDEDDDEENLWQIARRRLPYPSPRHGHWRFINIDRDDKPGQRERAPWQ